MECAFEDGARRQNLIVGYTARSFDPHDRRHLESTSDFVRGLPRFRRAAAGGVVGVWKIGAPPRCPPEFDHKLYRRLAEDEKAAWWQRLAWMQTGVWRSGITGGGCLRGVGRCFLADEFPDLTPPPPRDIRNLGSNKWSARSTIWIC